jgi:hypothetical protein
MMRWFVLVLLTSASACGNAMPADTVFACGANQCHSASEFCDDEIWGGVYDGGTHVDSCQALPADCNTCACLADAGWPNTPCLSVAGCIEVDGGVTVIETGCN